MQTMRIGMGEAPVEFLPRYGNRHGLIAGATGTGKSVSLMVLAEHYSRLGVPVFLADVKGDLAGLSQAGTMNEKIAARVETIGLPDYRNEASPVVFWDLYGELGHPVRTTVSQVGPTLLARIMELNDTQAGALAIAFEVADREGLLLLDLKDLRALLTHVADNHKTISRAIGLVSPASLAAIQRALLRLEQDGAEAFFGEPALELVDLMRQDMSGRGIINVLCAERLLLKPRLYSTFLLWLLSELFENLPEVGDLDQPKLVFFFDEAHLLFNDAPKALIERIELVVRLVRSKGVGVYFVTQNPLDVPDTVLAQLGNRVQHALRAFTPRDQKAVKAAAETMRPNPGIKDLAGAITELAVGEALVSFLDAKGRPCVTERVYVLPPGSQIGPITPEQRKALLAGSLVAGTYEKTVDRESAYERIKGRSEAAPAAAGASGAGAEPRPLPGQQPPAAAAAGGGGVMDMVKDMMLGTTGPRGGKQPGLVEKAASSAVRSIGTAVGREIIRGVLGSLLGGRRR